MANHWSPIETQTLMPFGMQVTNIQVASWDILLIPLNGFLTTVFRIYDRKHKHARTYTHSSTVYHQLFLTILIKISKCVGNAVRINIVEGACSKV